MTALEILQKLMNAMLDRDSIEKWHGFSQSQRSLTSADQFREIQKDSGQLPWRHAEAHDGRVTLPLAFTL